MTRSFVCTSLLIAGLACSQSGSPADKVALRVDGTEYSLDEFAEEVRRKAPALLEPAAPDSAVLAFAGGYLDKLVLSREAGISSDDGNPDLAARINRTKKEKVRKILREDASRHLTVDKIDEMFGWMSSEVRVRHIQTASLADARSIVEELKNGADFEQLVSTRSLDAFSKSRGGELPWFGFGEYPGLDEAAFELSVGEVSSPVLSHRGWHVLKLEETRPKENTKPTDPNFSDATKRRIGDHRLAQRLQVIAEERDTTWDTDAMTVVADSLIAFERRARARRTEIKNRQDAGELLTAADYAFERTPAFPPEIGKRAIATAGDYTFTIDDAAAAFATAPVDRLPTQYIQSALLNWLTLEVQAELAVGWAEAGGFPPGSDDARALEDAIRFVHVEALYKRAVHDQVVAGEKERREFFDAYRGSYTWRPDLDITLVRTDDETVARESRAALLDGQSADAIRTQFTSDSTLVVLTPPMARSFETIDGIDAPLPNLDGFIRTLPDEPGGTTPVSMLDGKFTAARIDKVGDSSPMSYEEAELLVADHCIAYLREVRLRDVLDSLRTVHAAHVDSAVVLQLPRR